MRRYDDLKAVIEAAEQPELIHIHRPIYVHKRSNNGAVCTCGCNSRRAYAYQELDHIDLLVNRITGTRKLRSEVQNKVGWDELSEQALRLDCPIRAYDKQVDLLLNATAKVVAVFGGERAGKSSWLKEWLADKVFLYGGHGAEFWWVAFSREKTQIGVSMLARGYKPEPGRWVAPVLPREFVLSYPNKETETDQAIRCIEGSAVHMKHAGRRGANLKGTAPLAIAVDEGCEIVEKSNWDTILGRTMDSGGQVGFASTPVLTSWAKEQIMDVGTKLENLDYTHSWRSLHASTTHG